MSNIPTDLKYVKSHEWIRDEGDGTVTIGITDHAQELLGDLVFVELPEIGVTASLDGEIGVIESVKAASDLYSPLSGEVTAVNNALEDAPETINDEAYEAGWIYKMTIADKTEMTQLLSADDYQALIDAEE